MRFELKCPCLGFWRKQQSDSSRLCGRKRRSFSRSSRSRTGQPFAASVRPETVLGGGLLPGRLLQPGYGSSLAGKHLRLWFQARRLLVAASAKSSATNKVAAVAGSGAAEALVAMWSGASGSNLSRGTAPRQWYRCLGHYLPGRCSAQTPRTHPRSQRCAGSPSNRGCQSKDTVNGAMGNGSAKLCIPAYRTPVCRS